MKQIAVFVAILLVLSISAVAEEGSDNAETRDADTAVSVRADVGSDTSNKEKDDTGTPARQRAERMQNEQKQRVAERRTLADMKKDEKLRELQKEHMEKLAQLSRERQEKLESLQKDQIERLTEVKEERLRKMAGLDKEQLEKIAALDKAQIERLAALDRTRLREYSGLSEEQLKERLEKVKVKRIDAAQLFKERIIMKEKVEAARQMEQQAKEQRTELKTELKAKREQLLQAARDNNPELLDHLKRYITNAIDIAIKHLELIKEKIAAHENIPEAEAQEITAQIDERITSLNGLKAKVQVAATVADAKAAGREFASSWKDLKIKFRRDETTLIRANVHEIIERSEHLESKLDKALAKMEEKGIDVSGIDEQVDAFSAKIAEAREKFKASQDLFAAAKEMTGEEGAAKVQEARAAAKEAHQLLKEAHELLKTILASLRQSGGESEADDVEAQETGEVEVVEVEAEAEVEVEVENE